MDEMRILKDCHEFIKRIYLLKLPHDEVYGLQSQIRRASISILLNITEGNGRNSPKDYLKFCYNARGSIYEVKECLILCYNLYGLLTEQELQMLVSISKQLTNLIQYLKSNIQNPTSQPKRADSKRIPPIF